MSRAHDKATQRLADARARVQEWKARAAELAAQRADAEATVGARALEVGVEQAAAGVAALRDQEAAARAAITAAEAARDQARVHQILTERADLLARADALDRDAGRQREVEAKAMRELERVAGYPEELRATLGDGFVVNGPSQGTVGVGWMPRSRALANEAEGLRARALELQRELHRLRPDVLARADELRADGTMRLGAALKRAETELAKALA